MGARFQLQMALDNANLRARFSTALLDWRTEKGHGDPKRFSQEEAVKELREVLAPEGLSIRAFQDWEGGHRMPRSWATTEKVCKHIGYDVTRLLEGEHDDGEAEPSNGGDARGARSLRELVAEQRRQGDLLAAIAAKVGVPVPPAANEDQAPPKRAARPRRRSTG